MVSNEAFIKFIKAKSWDKFLFIYKKKKEGLPIEIQWISHIRIPSFENVKSQNHVHLNKNYASRNGYHTIVTSQASSHQQEEGN